MYIIVFLYVCVILYVYTSRRIYTVCVRCPYIQAFFILYMHIHACHYAGPDFKQTGDRLKSVIHTLFQHTCRIIAPVNTATTIPPTGQGHGVDGSTCKATTTGTTSTAAATNTNRSSSSNSSGSEGGYGMTLVYDEEWSSARLSGGMSFA